MATANNWSAITDGDAFQSLVSTLILFEEPTARTFIRPGKDGAQDARTADGKRVWQAKHHRAPTIGKSIDDALEELAKIKEYRKSSHFNYELWKNVAEWTLVTNLEMNAASQLRWENEVLPEFKKEGIVANLWAKEQLEALLTKFPHVAAAYFEGQNRCFLSLAEAFNQAKSDRIGAAGLKANLEGRQSERGSIEAFLGGTKKLICVHGPGGIGKSRLLLEVGEIANSKGFEVVWGQEATLSSSSDWFSAITPERRTLLLLDEPKEPRLLDIISEQLSAGRMKTWKVLVSVRSPKDPVLRAVNEMSVDLRDTPIELAPLSKTEAETIARQLIENGPLASLPKEEKDRASSALAATGDRFPVWIVMAVSVLEKDRTLAQLPNNSAGLAAKYVQEVVEFSPPELADQKQINTLIRWLSAYGEINIEDTNVLAFLGQETGLSTEAAVQECLNSLVQRKFVVRRGVGGRLYSIRPDVVREFVVRAWLTQKTGGNFEATPAARRLIDLLFPRSGQTTIPNAPQLLKSIAALEFSERLQGHEIDLLGPIFAHLSVRVNEGTLLDQQKVIEYLRHIAFARVSESLVLVDLIRKTPREPVEIANPLFGKSEITHDKVLAQLPWLIFEIAYYASTNDERLTILRQLADLFCREFVGDERNWNDGKRAKDLVSRVIRGEVNFRTNFWENGFNEARALLGRVKANRDATDAELGLLDVFCQPFLTLEREQTTFDRTKFTVRRWLVQLGSEGGKKRGDLRNLIRELLTDNTMSRAVRVAAWRLLEDAHSDANRAIIGVKPGENETFVAEIRRDLSADLEWTLDFLNKSKLEIWELKAARAMWDWHRKFDSDTTLKELAEKCEEIYQGDPLAAEFHVLFSHERYEEGGAKAAQIGGKLGESGTERDIAEFLSNAEKFGSIEANWHVIAQIGTEIGKHWERNSEIQKFAKAALVQDSDSLHFKFSTAVLAERLRTLRSAEKDDELKKILDEWLAIPRDPKHRAQLLWLLYQRPHPLLTGILRKPDFETLLLALGLADDPGFGDEILPVNKLRLIAGVHHVEPGRFRTLAEEIWTDLPDNQKAAGLAVLIDAMTFLDAFKSDYSELAIAADHYDWFLDFLVQLPDIGELTGHSEWELSQLIQRFGRKPVQWLLESIKKRLKLAEQHQEGSTEFKLLPLGSDLLRYIKPIDNIEASSPEVKAAIPSLLNYYSRPDTLGYVVPEYAVAIDPTGLLVPDAVVAQLERLGGEAKEEMWRWSRFAGHYAFNSEPWRKIAIAAVVAAAKLTTRDQISIFVNLLEQGFKSSSFGADEMDPRFAEELQLRRDELTKETADWLIPFREWAVRVAQSEYDRALAEFREESEDE
jgi:hypothetical protein